jgi:hypothetical protein
MPITKNTLKLKIKSCMERERRGEAGGSMAANPYIPRNIFAGKVENRTDPT